LDLQKLGGRIAVGTSDTRTGEMMTSTLRLLVSVALSILAVACVHNGSNSEESWPQREISGLSFSEPPSPKHMSANEAVRHTSPLSTPIPSGSPTVSDTRRSSSEPNQYAIELKVAKFDPLADVLPISEDLTLDESQPDEGYYIVQFDGPILSDWQNALDATGAKRIGYVPNYAYLVEVTADQKRKVATLPHLRWLGPYQPGYKISPDLSRQVENRSKLTVLTFPETDTRAIETNIIEWGGIIEDMSKNQYSGTIFVDFDMKYIVQLARLPGVMWIEPWSRPSLR
jgi:hypothetical protein